MITTGLAPTVRPSKELRSVNGKRNTEKKVIKKRMKVKIKRIDKKLPLPKYETSGAVAFDLLARVDSEIAPHSIGRVPANIVVEIPEGFMLLVKDRSSTSARKGLLCAVGFVDQDYCGDEDEITMQFYNFKDEPVLIKKGERIGQAAFVAIAANFEWLEVEKTGRDNRGGFGSTGE